MAWQRLFYGAMYRWGHPRWDTGITPPELVEAIEGPGALPAGRALDLGCGTGTNAVYLARHGWEATGVDFVPRAIARARRRAAAAGVAARFVAGDVTRLRELGVAGPFDLVVDIGCFHGIPAGRRDGYASGLASVTVAGATMLLFGFARPFTRGSPGAPEDEVRARLGRWWELVHVLQGEEDHPGEARHPAWYRLVRRQGPRA